MGNISSRLGEGDGPYLRDQNRFSIASLTIANAKNQIILNVTPNAFPATRYIPKKEFGDESTIEYVQDPESTAVGSPPTFLLRLSNEDELHFTFTFIVRQTAMQSSANTTNGTVPVTSTMDSTILGLTYVFASHMKELDNLVTKEFHADPNLHKNPNVQLLGDYKTDGSSSVQFQWTWKWKPPKATEDRGGGWRTCCSFVEYDQRAHKLNTLASFSYWVSKTARPKSPTVSSSPRLELNVPPRLRVPSSQSIESRVSDSDGGEGRDTREPPSPGFEPIPEDGLGLVPAMTTTTASTAVASKIDVSCQRADDLDHVDDGPLFRATMKSLEQKTANTRTKWKKVLKKAEAAMEAQVASNNAMADLQEALRETSQGSANAVQPAIDHYFNKSAKDILAYQRSTATHIKSLIIDPISRLYNIDIKQAEAKKKEFEDESKDYYSYVGRYLGQRSDSMKEKKRVETDSKYQSKRRNFELKRFDYSSFMQDLHGGRKDQEVLSHLTRFADAQARGYVDTAKKVETLLPQLEALSAEVREADKSFQIQRTEREEKRRALEKSTSYLEPDSSGTVISDAGARQVSTSRSVNDGDLPPRASSLVTSRSQITSPMNTAPPALKTQPLPIGNPGLQGISVSTPTNPVGSPNQNRFKGIRDLEDGYNSQAALASTGQAQHRKEGLLWALSRPGSHADPKGLNKQAWHKFWIVLDAGKLTEYTNWKDKLDLHMDPIDLRMASVREARNVERRFCFEVITPQFTRVYQATSEDDMRIWIASVNNALQSAMEAKTEKKMSTDSLPGVARRDIASVLTGKSTSVSSHRSSYQQVSSASKAPSRHATVGDRPHRASDVPDEEPNKLLELIKNADAGNQVCADCGANGMVDERGPQPRVEWASINLGIVLCIECTGIHRSLGTHISRLKSFTLDTPSFTQDLIELMLTVGNRKSNEIWEARLDSSLKINPRSSRVERLQFIKLKYEERAFVQPISTTLSHYSTPDETLLASVKRNDLRNVLYALALRANVNITDRSRNTPVLFLALAAADPASPSANTTPLSSPAPNAASQPQPTTRKSFPMAELLLLNGANLPTTQPPFPLSTSARFYLDHKAEQRSGKTTNLAPPAPAPSYQTNITGSEITALPQITAGSGSTPLERNKDREREAKLQKRVSGSNRLMKHPSDGSRGI